MSLKRFSSSGEVIEKVKFQDTDIQTEEIQTEGRQGELDLAEI